MRNDQNYFCDERIWRYCLDHTKPESQRLLELKHETYDSLHGSQMISETMVIKLIQFFVSSMAADICVDIGTFSGVSALAMAESSSRQTKIYTIDRPHQIGHDLAQRFIEANGFEDKIITLIGDANDMIDRLPENIDFVFIDADKKQTRLYFDRLIDKVRAGGILLVDDVLWRGEVLDPVDKRAQALNDFNRYICEHPTVDNVLLPLRHGLNLIRKR
ncbi:MAG: O-methyltransferase [Francisellaceae bacterium]